MRYFITKRMYRKIIHERAIFTFDHLKIDHLSNKFWRKNRIKHLKSKGK